jgi:hypothetical protein
MNGAGAQACVVYGLTSTHAQVVVIGQSEPKVQRAQAPTNHQLLTVVQLRQPATQHNTTLHNKVKYTTQDVPALVTQRLYALGWHAHAMQPAADCCRDDKHKNAPEWGCGQRAQRPFRS